MRKTSKKVFWWLTCTTWKIWSSLKLKFLVLRGNYRYVAKYKVLIFLFVEMFHTWENYIWEKVLYLQMWITDGNIYIIFVIFCWILKFWFMFDRAANVLTQLLYVGLSPPFHGAGGRPEAWFTRSVSTLLWRGPL